MGFEPLHFPAGAKFGTPGPALSLLVPLIIHLSSLSYGRK